MEVGEVDVNEGTISKVNEGKCDDKESEGKCAGK